MVVERAAPAEPLVPVVQAVRLALPVAVAKGAPMPAMQGSEMDRPTDHQTVREMEVTEAAVPQEHQAQPEPQVPREQPVQVVRPVQVAMQVPRETEERRARLDPAEPAARVELAARPVVLGPADRRAAVAARRVRPAPEVRAQPQVQAAEPQEPLAKAEPAEPAEPALEPAARARAMTVVVRAVSVRARARATGTRAV